MGNVRVIVLVENSVRFYSAYLPLIYGEVVKQPSKEQPQRLVDMRRNSLERVTTVLDEFECGRALE